MTYIDCHAHISSSAFDSDRIQILRSAEESGVEAIINCSTEFSDWEKVLKHGSEFKVLKTALGVHPWYIPDDYEILLRNIDTSIFRKIFAIGEIGLDRRFAKSGMDIQKKVFTDFLVLSMEFNLPVTIHCIGAFNEIIGIFKKTGPFRNPVIIHAFNGSRELAESLSKYNVYFSVGGILTYRDSKKRSEMINYIYPDRMLLETDSPDIPVIEKKKERNIPENIIFIANAAAEILNESHEKVARNTTSLAREIFGV